MAEEDLSPKPLYNPAWWLLGLAVKGPWLGLGWVLGSYLCCLDRLRKHYSQARKATWYLSGNMASKSADSCMFVNKWGWLRY